MPRTCTICTHPQLNVNEINRALINGEPYRVVARRYGLSRSAMFRHRKKCIARQLAEAQKKAKRAQALITAQTVEAARRARERQELAELQTADGIIRSIADLHTRTLKILRDAEAEADRGNALRAIKEARNNLELLARLSGTLQESSGGRVEISVHYVDKALIAVAQPPRASSASPAAPYGNLDLAVRENAPKQPALPQAPEVAD